jgi:hypothetical protein
MLSMAGIELPPDLRACLSRSLDRHLTGRDWLALTPHGLAQDGMRMLVIAV